MKWRQLKLHKMWHVERWLWCYKASRRKHAHMQGQVKLEIADTKNRHRCRLNLAAKNAKWHKWIANSRMTSKVLYEVRTQQNAIIGQCLSRVQWHARDSRILCISHSQWSKLDSIYSKEPHLMVTLAKSTPKKFKLLWSLLPNHWSASPWVLLRSAA